MTKINFVFLIAVTIFLCCLYACKEDDGLSVQECTPQPSFTTFVEGKQQRVGDVDAGRNFLLYGDYVSSGVPYDVYLAVFGPDNENILERTGDNAVVRYDFSAVDAPNGARVIAPNCLQCHASTINGEFVMGLGNAGADFTADQSGQLPLVDAVIFGQYGDGSPEWEAYQPFRLATAATAPYLVADVRGANPADKLAAVLSAHRDANTLVWNETPAYEIPQELIPTDVPPWWVLKKKNAMFYSALGNGDFCRFLMGSSLLTMANDSTAQQLDDKFPDLLAYLYTLEPPVYPENINNTIAEEGKAIFAENCQECHGTYGTEASFPNLLVDLQRIGTDPLLVEGYQGTHYEYMVNWFNNGWFGQDPNGGQLVARNGYLAQPLDGIWASAPYLHNGSVPTLEDLLNSSQRPTYWKRSFNTSDIDFEKVGWNYTVETSKVDSDTYDTTKEGYGNQGHYFGDNLSSTERSALIEYLKTL